MSISSLLCTTLKLCVVLIFFSLSCNKRSIPPLCRSMVPTGFTLEFQLPLPSGLLKSVMLLRFPYTVNLVRGEKRSPNSLALYRSSMPPPASTLAIHPTLYCFFRLTSMTNGCSPLFSNPMALSLSLCFS